jgi:hypothetical protein
MPTRLSKILILALAGVLIASGADAASRKRPPTRPDSADSVFWGGLVPMENGTPVIMKGYHPPKRAPEEPAPQRRSERPVKIPRGSSTYIPPVNPTPDGANSPPAAALMQPPAAPYRPPPINSFGDRVIDAIHAYPLERGLGNNPTDQQQFIRQRANQ